MHFIVRKQLSYVIIGTALVLGVFVPAEPILKSVREIRDLSFEESKTGLVVDLNGQVLFVLPGSHGLFLYDGTSSVFIDFGSMVPRPDTIERGDFIHVKGKSDPGGFATDVLVNEVTVIEQRALPEGRPITNEELYCSSIDCDWVQVVGRVVSSSVNRRKSHVLMGVEIDNLLFDVQIPYSENDVNIISDLMFREVQFNAVVGTLFNKKRQSMGRIFFITSASDMTPVDDAVHPDALTVVPIHELLRFGMDEGKPIKTHGIVLFAGREEIYLRGEQSNLKVKVLPGVDVQVGDDVEVTGFVWMQPIDPAFRARSVSVLGSVEKPEPIPFEFGELIPSDFNGELIQLSVFLEDVGKTFENSDLEQSSLKCRSGRYQFEAFLPTGMELPEDVQAGAHLDLIGICKLIRNPYVSGELVIEGLELQLRSGADIMVTKQAPWWTPIRLIWALGLLLGVIVLFLVWIGLLHRTVDKQTGIIGEQVERETLLKERQRIARELHDNLEQGLVGMAIQIQGLLRVVELNVKSSIQMIKGHYESSGKKRALAVIEAGAVQERHSIQVLQEMLDHCSGESRSSILYLRGEVLERKGLLAALGEVLLPIADEAGVVLEFLEKGLVRMLNEETERNLLLVVKESVTNAIRHGKPKEINVEMCYNDEALSIRISDDGCGFNVQDAQKSGHFGLIGMHERVEQLNGTLEIKSELDLGTNVVLVLPSIREWEIK